MSAGCVHPCLETCTSCRWGRLKDSIKAILPAVLHRTSWWSKSKPKSMRPPIREWPRGWNAPPRWSRSSAGWGSPGRTSAAITIRTVSAGSSNVRKFWRLKWEELAAELEFAPKGGFYFFESPKREPQKQTFWNHVADIIEPANTPRVLKGVITGTLRLIDKSPAAARALESVELAFKKPVFGCQACGNCVLGLMEYVCPMTCPKNLRNGPCGGTNNGQCEVIPEQKCIWVEVYNRAKAADRVDELKTYIPQRDRSLKGTSSYINYFLNRDSRPEHPQPLIQISVSPAQPEEQLVKSK